jgi:hypothetical protein
MATTMVPAAPAELRARLTEAMAEVAPLVPVVARAAAAFREAAQCASSVFPTDSEFDAGHERFMAECGAYALGDVLERVAELIGPL